uniref:Uncharacterized protein n=1 Tax=Anopheles coluzzii TaxID=1518534 RepID=A0A8W7PNY1_ANOCL
MSRPSPFAPPVTSAVQPDMFFFVALRVSPAKNCTTSGTSRTKNVTTSSTTEATKRSVSTRLAPALEDVGFPLSAFWYGININDALQVGRFAFAERKYRQQASIVDQHVHWAKLGFHLQPQPFYRLVVGNIGQKSFRLHAERAHIFYGPLRSGQIDIDHGHLAAFPGQSKA